MGGVKGGLVPREIFEFLSLGSVSKHFGIVLSKVLSIYSSYTFTERIPKILNIVYMLHHRHMQIHIENVKRFMYIHNADMDSKVKH